MLRAVWDARGESGADLDEECSPAKVCKNRKGMTFDGYGRAGHRPAPGLEGHAAREGKFGTGERIRDLVLGPTRVDRA